MISAKYIRIAAVSAFMLLGVFALGSRVSSRASVPPAPPVLTPEVIEGEAETFRLADQGYRFLASSEEKNTRRTLDVFDSRRAFPGAPPVIPHPLLEDRSMGGKGCLGCHKDGGYVPAFKAHTPITPHPQYDNCRQCHVPQSKEVALFAASKFQRIQAPAIDGQSLPGGPPPIPHSLAMRENCLACHAGPGAVAEIRTPHPERTNCRQCHVPSEDTGVFQRGGLR
jgi:nitrate reductase (cytochrome), electron transfer subunit